MYFASSHVGKSQSLASRMSARRDGSVGLMSSTLRIDDIDSLPLMISDRLISTTRWMMPQLLHWAYLGTTLSSSPRTEKTVNWCNGGFGCRLNCNSVQQHVTRCLMPIAIRSPPQDVPGRRQTCSQGRPAFFFAAACSRASASGDATIAASTTLPNDREPLWYPSSIEAAMRAINLGTSLASIASCPVRSACVTLADAASFMTSINVQEALFSMSRGFFSPMVHLLRL